MPHLQFLQLEMNLNMLCLVLFFYFLVVILVWVSRWFVCLDLSFWLGLDFVVARVGYVVVDLLGLCLNTQDINWKRKNIFIKWRINQIKLDTKFSLNTKPTLIMPQKKKSNHIHSSKHTHLPKKKVQQLNKTQMRRLKWVCKTERERQRERERVISSWNDWSVWFSACNKLKMLKIYMRGWECVLGERGVFDLFWVLF